VTRRTRSEQQLHDLIEQSFAAGWSISRVIGTYLISYEYAYEIKKRMTLPPKRRRCATEEMRHDAAV
jgi:hypothetical protein